MNQSVMAGIGNIYRTEILWRQAVHPETLGKDIDRQTFDRIWNDAKALLTLGVKHNAILTKSGANRSKSNHREDFNIFAKETCPDCKGEIGRFEIGFLFFGWRRGYGRINHICQRGCARAAKASGGPLPCQPQRQILPEGGSRRRGNARKA